MLNPRVPQIRRSPHAVAIFSPISHTMSHNTSTTPIDIIHTINSNHHISLSYAHTESLHIAFEQENKQVMMHALIRDFMSSGEGFIKSVTRCEKSTQEIELGWHLKFLKQQEMLANDAFWAKSATFMEYFAESKQRSEALLQMMKWPVSEPFPNKDIPRIPQDFTEGVWKEAWDILGAQSFPYNPSFLDVLFRLVVTKHPLLTAFPFSFPHRDVYWRLHAKLVAESEDHLFCVAPQHQKKAQIIETVGLYHAWLHQLTQARNISKALGTYRSDMPEIATLQDRLIRDLEQGLMNDPERAYSQYKHEIDRFTRNLTDRGPRVSSTTKDPFEEAYFMNLHERFEENPGKSWERDERMEHFNNRFRFFHLFGPVTNATVDLHQVKQFCKKDEYTELILLLGIGESEKGLDSSTRRNASTLLP